MKNYLLNLSKNLFEPFGKIKKKELIVLVLIQSIVGIVIWEMCSKGGLMPKPSLIFKEMLLLWNSSVFWNSVYNSIMLSVQAIGVGIFISAILMYLYTIEFFKPIIKFIAQLRFLTISALIPVFIILLDSPTTIKMSALLVGIVTFFVASLISVVNDLNPQEQQLCYTLKMNKWETLYHTIITGKLRDLAITIVVNMAIAYTMITMVEGISMSTDGIGVMIFKAQKYLNLNKVFALLVNVLLIGLGLVGVGNVLVKLFSSHIKSK